MFWVALVPATHVRMTLSMKCEINTIQSDLRVTADEDDVLLVSCQGQLRCPATEGDSFGLVLGRGEVAGFWDETVKCARSFLA
ncbi:hypothetical protein NDU88_003175 [Pleurodeles waltl]|uniref:Uncharacterized protein n=1 Tax=Pleurodeles waltl TaxID=8319 RepID=A0AAV7MZE7_PLEWA|nr:hypothetical protein NDU88_003175 [Pleurodeles waltl]